MSANVTSAIVEIVEAACQQETNAFGYDIWTHHITTVVKYGRELADLLGADAEIVEIAALLHDYAGIKDHTLYEEHHLHSAAEAERILTELQYPPERIAVVCGCIQSHRGSRVLEKATLEEVCLSSADAMAHIAHVPSLLRLAFVKRGMDVDEGTTWVRQKLERSWNKLCPEAREIIAARYEAAKQVLSTGHESR